MKNLCVFIWLLSLFLVNNVSVAETKKGISLSETDVAGIKIGMNPSQAKSALLEFDKDFKIVDKFIKSRIRYPEIESNDKKKDEGPSYLFGFEGTKDTDDSHEVILTYFDPKDEQGGDKESVIAVMRWKTYLNDLPRVDTLRSGLEEKMKQKPTYSDKVIDIWQFNARGNIQKISDSFSSHVGVMKYEKPQPKQKESPKTTEEFSANVSQMVMSGVSGRGYGRSFSSSGSTQYVVTSMMPGSISSSDGKALQFAIHHDKTNDLLANAFSCLLLDTEKLILAFDKGNSMLANKLQEISNKEKETGAANKTRKEKF